MELEEAATAMKDILGLTYEPLAAKFPCNMTTTDFGCFRHFY